MSSFNWDQYEPEVATENPPQKTLPKNTPPLKFEKTPESFDWSDYEKSSFPEEVEKEPDSLPAKIFRYVYSLPSGIGQAFTWPLDAVNFLAQGEGLSGLEEYEQNWEKWQQQWPGVQFPDPNSEDFRKKYLEAVVSGSEYFPSQSNIERIIEEKTGAPLVATDKLQKLIRLGGMAGAFQKTLGKAAVAGVTAPVVSGTAQVLGANEGVADVLGLLASPAPGAINQAIKKSLPSSKAAALESKIIGAEKQPSSFETAESILKDLQSTPETNEGALGLRIPQQNKPSINVEGRTITSKGKDLGVRPSKTFEATNLKDVVGNTISPQKFYNTTEGGKAITDEVRRLDEEVYRGVNNLYKRSRELNSQIENIQPNLVEDLTPRIRELEKIPEPSDVQKRLITAMKKIRNDLAHIGEDGEVIGYKPINNQTLIDQVQSLRQIVDYDFSHGNTKNIFKPLINSIEDAVINTSKQSGNLEAVAANIEAKNAYKNWVNAFDTPYMRPLRDRSNKDFSKSFKSALDLDEYNVLSPILNASERGKLLNQAVSRDLVEKHLAPFLENPHKANTREFNKTLRELDAVLPPGMTQQIRNKFNASRKTPSFRAKAKPFTKAEEASSKYLKLKPEDIQAKMNSRSGIRELRQDLSGSESRKKLFNQLERQKLRSLLREGNIEKEFTGNDVYNVLNKEKNAEIFREIMGEQEFEAARQEFKEIGKKQIRIDNLTKYSKYIGVLKFLHNFSPL